MFLNKKYIYYELLGYLGYYMSKRIEQSVDSLRSFNYFVLLKYYTINIP